MRNLPSSLNILGPFIRQFKGVVGTALPSSADSFRLEVGYGVVPTTNEPFSDGFDYYLNVFFSLCDFG